MHKFYETDGYALKCVATTDGSWKVTSIVFKDSGGKVVLPEQIDGIPITQIGSKVLKDERTFVQMGVFHCEELILPKTINSLDPWAFEFAKVSKIFLPKSITYIPEKCFSNSFVKEIVFEDIGVITGVGDKAFYSCGIKHFVWPRNCDVIPKGCFCFSALEDISGLENVTRIEESAFMGTSHLQNFDWPARCNKIPERCFSGSRITNITGIEDVQEVGEEAFKSAVSLEVDFAWPHKCTIIPYSCFADSSITGINGIENVVEISRLAFGRCYNISEFKWPKNCKTVPSECFAGSGLKAITGLETVEKINELAFSFCQLSRIKLGPELKEISVSAFSSHHDYRTIVEIDAQDCGDIKIICNPMYSSTGNYSMVLQSLVKKIYRSFETSLSVEYREESEIECPF